MGSEWGPCAPIFLGELKMGDDQITVDPGFGLSFGGFGFPSGATAVDQTTDSSMAGQNYGLSGSGVKLGGGYTLPADQVDGAKLDKYAPQASAEVLSGSKAPDAWWEKLIAYGAVRAIDNAYGNPYPGVMGNTAPGYGASQSGRTYAIGQGSATAPYVIGGAAVAAQRSGMSGMLVIGLIALAML